MFSVQNISVKHLGKHLLNDISFDLCAGEVLAVIGPNGSGKSTLLKTLSSDLAPASGSIRLNNKLLHHYHKKQLAQVRAVLPQSTEMNFPFTVKEIVEMGRIPYSRHSLSNYDKDLIKHAMEITQVTHLKERSITYLSGGERQRVQLARVLCQVLGPEHSHRYLLLDEPTSALDLSHQHHVLAIVTELAQQHGIGIMIILHDLNLAALYADKILVLKNGELAHWGSPNHVLQAQHIQNVFGMPVDVIGHPSSPCQLVISNRHPPTKEPVRHVF